MRQDRRKSSELGQIVEESKTVNRKSGPFGLISQETVPIPELPKGAYLSNENEDNQDNQNRLREANVEQAPSSYDDEVGTSTLRDQVSPYFPKGGANRTQSLQEGTLDGDAEVFLAKDGDQRFIVMNGIRYTRPN
jgi:hypothetical protein